MKDLSSDDLITKEVTLKGIRGVPFDCFLRAVETIESRRYPLEKLHTYAFPRGGDGRGHKDPGRRD